MCASPFSESAGRHGRGSDSDAARDERALRVVGDGVLVARDARAVEPVGHVLAREVFRAQVDEHEVIIGAARNERQPAGQKGLGEERPARSL